MGKKKNIKKLIFKSQYVSEEFTEVEDMMASYKEHFYKEFPEEYKKMMTNREGGQTNISGSVETVDEEQEFEPKEEHEYSTTMKALYRRITKITHPDKVESEFLTSYFQKASSAYADNNISELFTIASVLNIDTSDIDPGDIITELENSIVSKQFQTLAMKSSLAWKWAMAKTEEEKDSLRKFIKQYVEDNY
tara:strand:+ start:142 stop:717 length:576 start_codon:yes stop_codon:yes gene_type:complete